MLKTVIHLRLFLLIWLGYKKNLFVTTEFPVCIGVSDGFKTIILLFQHSLQLMCIAPLSL